MSGDIISIDEIIQIIARDLDIKPGNKETFHDWQKRVVYSYIGLNMLAAVYDYDDIEINDNHKKTVSKQHIMNRGKELANIFLLEYDDDFLQEMQKLYIKTGYLLDSPNRLTYPSFRCCLADCNFLLTRGQLPWTVNKMSGLGTLASEYSNTELTVWEEMFDIEKTPILEWFAQFIKTVQWSDYQLPQDVEYLNIIGKPTNRYWQKNIDNNSLTLCREHNNIDFRQYWLIDLSKRRAIYKVPKWQANDNEYLRIALALRVQAKNFPIVRVQHMGDISKVEIDYLLPPAEHNFFELYSWPYNNKPQWNRIVSKDVWPYFKVMFSRLGFRIINKDNMEEYKWKQ